MSPFLKALPGQVPMDDNTLAGIRVGQFSATVTRIVLDIKRELPAYRASSQAVSDHIQRFSLYWPTTTIHPAARNKTEYPLQEQPQTPDPSPDIEPITTPDTGNSNSNGSGISIKSLRFSGNKAIPPHTLRTATTGWLGTHVTPANLRNLVSKINTLCRDVNLLCHTYVRPESKASGNLEVVVVEAKFGAVKFAPGTDSRLKEYAAYSYILAQHTPGTPLQPLKIEKGVRILNEVPGISASFALAPSATPEHTDVVLSIKDRQKNTSILRGDNHGGSDATGRQRLVYTASINNPSGYGEQWTALALLSSRSNYARLGYETPLGRLGLRGGIYLGSMSYQAAATASTPENQGNAVSWGANISYPLVRDGDNNLTLLANYDQRDMVNSSFDFTMMNRDTNTLGLSLAGNHRGNRGLSSFGISWITGKLDLNQDSSEYSTDQAGPGTNGNFGKLTWNLGQQIPVGNRGEFAAMFFGQFANKNLEAGEKFALGGPNAIRAYAPFEGQGDEGWLGKLEWRYSLNTELRLLAFADVGEVLVNKNPWTDWDKHNPEQPNRFMLSGAGVGFNWFAPYGIEVQGALAVPIGTNPANSPGTGDDSNPLKRSNAWLSLQKSY